nr:hypothetical protein [Tanacetum cinerariifolium]
MEELKQQYLDELKRLGNLEYHDEIKIVELTKNFNCMSIEIRKKEKLLQLKQWANLSTHPSKRLNSNCYDDDDDDYTLAKFKEYLFSYCIEIGILQDFSEPSNDNTNVVNARQEPFVVEQDPGKNSSQSPSQINHHCCFECGDSLKDIFFHKCTCELCGRGAHYGYNCPPKVPVVLDPKPFNNQTVDELPQTLPSFDPTCYSKDGNSFSYHSTSNLVHDSPNVFNSPLQPSIYSNDFCGNDAYYGHNCSLQVPFTYDPEPCYNQDFNFPQNFQIFQQYLCCTHCEFPVIHQLIREKTCAELLAEEHEANIDTQPFQYSVVPQPLQEEMSVEFLREKRNQMDYVKTFLRKFNRISFYEMPKVLSLSWETILEIDLAFEDKHCQPEDILELFRRLHNDVQNIHKELAVYINTPNWDHPTVCYDDDNDEDYTIAVTPSLSIEEPDNSLSMGDEHLDTVPAIESDEFIKSSVENLVPIPSESAGIPDNMCDVPFHDNSPPLDVSKDQFVDFSNFSDESTSTDDDSLSIDNIEYVEASPPNSELISLEVMEIVIPEVGGIDDDILLTIKDDILREKLLNVNLLIANVKALNDNPTPAFDFMTKNEDTIFDPGICSYHISSFMPDVSHRSGTSIKFKVLNESPMEILFSTCPHGPMNSGSSQV